MALTQVFVYLQLLDLLTTLLGLRLGAVEASPFVRLLMSRICASKATDSVKRPWRR